MMIIPAHIFFWQAHLNNAVLPKHLHTPYMKMPLWWLGMGMVISGSIGDFIALGLGQVSLVTAVGGAAVLTTNLVVARYWHKEDLDVRDVTGIVFIIAGAVVIAYTAPPAQDYDLGQLQVRGTGRNDT